MFQDRLKTLRTKNGLTQQELAKKIGVSQASIFYWETGKREPSFKTIEKLAKVFGCDPLYLSGYISEDTAYDLVNAVPYQKALFAIIRELYGKIELKHVSIADTGRMFYYLIGDNPEIAMDEIHFDNMVEDIENLIKKHIENYGTDEKSEIEDLKRILKKIR